MRKFIVALVLFLGVYFIIIRLTEVQKILNTLQKGRWDFLLLSVFAVGFWLVNIALCFQVIYKAIGIDEKVVNLIPMAAAGFFLNVVAPTAGMSGMAIFFAEARRRNYSSGRAAVGGALYVLFDYIAFLFVLTLGFIVLIRRNDLNIGEIFAAGILIVIASLISFLIYLGMHSADKLGQLLAWASKLINRILQPFLHREYLSAQRAIKFAEEASGGLRELLMEPKKLTSPLAFALLKQGISILLLWLSFLAFEIPVSPGTVIAGYSISYLILIVSPTPSGVGFVESALPFLLKSMYIPLEAAAVITLTYRTFTFWLPLLIGMIAFRWLGGQKSI